MSIEQMSIYYRPDDYDAHTARMYGRISANEGLLNGIVQHGRRSSLGFYIEEGAHFHHLQSQLSNSLQVNAKKIHPIFQGDIFSLQRSDLYFMTDPMLAASAWTRSVMNTNAYSLCGLTHTTSSLSFFEEIGKLILAPLEAWDALICTSIAVRKVIKTIFEQWYAYLEKYRQMQYQSPLQLPVIPLGVHVNQVSCLEKKQILRKEFREKWKIKEKDFVVLFYGRLSYYEKSHPVPMYMVLESVAKRLPAESSLYCIQAGWFESPEDHDYFQQAMKTFCPSVKSVFILNFKSEEKPALCSGADVFISLADNIQESFGLTPLEAMANELPVIVSDWDGYKDTVRQGIDGFRIPTIMPSSGCGKDLGLGYLSRAINFHTYCGLSAQMTAIDIKSCVDALWQLYSSAELRKRMGKSARQHVMDNFDWKVIVKQYDELWDALTEKRLQTAPQTQKPLSPAPMIADPYQLYAAYPTHVLNGPHLLSLSEQAYETLTLIQAGPLCHFGWQQRLSASNLLNILDRIKQCGPQTVEQIVDFMTKLDASMSSGTIARSLTYLIKYDVLQYTL